MFQHSTTEKRRAPGARRINPQKGRRHGTAWQGEGDDGRGERGQMCKINKAIKGDRDELIKESFNDSGLARDVFWRCDLLHRRSRGCRANQSAAFEISRIAPSNCAKAFGSVAVNISNPINDKKTQARRHFLLHSNLSARLWLEFEIDYVIQSQCQYVRTNFPENRFWFSAIVGRRGKDFRLIFNFSSFET